MRYPAVRHVCASMYIESWFSGREVREQALAADATLNKNRFRGSAPDHPTHVGPVAMLFAHRVT